MPIALLLYPFAPWESGAAHFVNMIGNTMDPIFGVMMVDYYLIRKGRVDVEALYREHGEFRLARQRAHRRRHRHSVLIDPAVSRRSCRPGGGEYGWFFGVAIAGGLYYGLRSTKSGLAPSRT